MCSDVKIDTRLAVERLWPLTSESICERLDEMDVEEVAGAVIVIAVDAIDHDDGYREVCHEVRGAQKD